MRRARPTLEQQQQQQRYSRSRRHGPVPKVLFPSQTTPVWLFVFIGGFITGHLTGFWYASSGSMASLYLLTAQSQDQTSLLSTQLVNQSGWTSIDVFYGTRDHLEIIPSNTTTTQLWFSQARQDELIIRLLRHQPRGYFIDLAANDAVHLSNTLALERPPYAWQGLCIEPNPVYWKNLSYRTCQTVGAVVGAQRDDEVYFRYEAGTHGGIVGFDNGPRWKATSVRQSTVTLWEIFQRYAVPSTIDYLSLDVEGAEGFILMQLPLEHYKIKLITAERLKGPVRQFLRNHSYEFCQKLTRWGESLWVHQDYKAEMVRWSVRLLAGLVLLCRMPKDSHQGSIVQYTLNRIGVSWKNLVFHSSKNDSYVRKNTTLPNHIT